MNALRRFSDLDNHRAVEVGHMRRGLRLFKVKNRKQVKIVQKFLRKGADDLTPRAEEKDTLKACINVDNSEENFGDRLWWAQTGTSFVKQFMKELKDMSGILFGRQPIRTISGGFRN